MVESNAMEVNIRDGSRQTVGVQSVGRGLVHLDEEPYIKVRVHRD